METDIDISNLGHNRVILRKKHNTEALNRKNRNSPGTVIVDSTDAVERSISKHINRLVI